MDSREVRRPGCDRWLANRALQLCIAHGDPLSRRDSPELFEKASPSGKRGRREDRAPAGAHGPRATKSTRQNHRLSRDHPAFPARWCYDLYAISPGTGLIAPVAGDLSSADLASAPGCQNHATSPSHRDRSSARNTRAATQCAHRIPHPTSVTIAKRPLCGTGCGE